MTQVRTEMRAVRIGHAGFAGFGAEQYPFLPEQRHIAQFAGLQRVRIVDEEPAGRNRERAAFQRLRLEQNLEIDLITHRSEEHTSELQSLMRISYAVFCLKKKIRQNTPKP